ncbi:lipid A deacylase LpxR family protein [Helicobacter jaachi]|nr:lipid A deacylase LpxR family protein [Helicobacter jaachi]
MRKHLRLACFLAFVWNIGYAQPYGKHTLSFIHENDVFTIESADRYYTAGSVLVYASKEYDLWRNKHLLSFMRFLDPLALSGDNSNFTRFQLGITQKIYTPSIRSNGFLRDNRPFAGMLAGFFDVQHRRAHSLENLALWIGVVGEQALGGQSQNRLHHIIGAPIWSWEHQIPNDFYFLLSYSYMHRLHAMSRAFFDVDLLPFGHIDVGNYNGNAQVGSYARIGYGLEQNLIPSRLNYGILSASVGNGFFMYGYASARAMFVGYNSLITGKQSSFNDLHLRHINYALESGFALGYRGFALMVSWVYQGREFKEQAQNNTYGSISLSVAF